MAFDDDVKEKEDALLEMSRSHAIQMAQSLAPLRTSQAFKVFLGLIREDLEGVRVKRSAIPSETNYAPAMFECRALEDYMVSLLGRVDAYTKESQAYQETEQKDNE